MCGIATCPSSSSHRRQKGIGEMRVRALAVCLRASYITGTTSTSPTASKASARALGLKAGCVSRRSPAPRYGPPFPPNPKSKSVRVGFGADLAPLAGLAAHAGIVKWAPRPRPAGVDDAIAWFASLPK